MSAMNVLLQHPWFWFELSLSAGLIGARRAPRTGLTAYLHARRCSRPRTASTMSLVRRETRVIALAFFVATSAPVSLGPFHPGQSFADAQSSAGRAGLTLRQYESRGASASYWVLSGSDPRGSVGFCRGAVVSASFNVNGYDEFTRLLRVAIANYGQPQVSVDTKEVVDASRSLEIMTFKWPSHYELSFLARQSDGMYGFQSFMPGTKCL